MIVKRKMSHANLSFILNSKADCRSDLEAAERAKRPDYSGCGRSLAKISFPESGLAFAPIGSV